MPARKIENVNNIAMTWIVIMQRSICKGVEAQHPVVSENFQPQTKSSDLVNRDHGLQENPEKGCVEQTRVAVGKFSRQILRQGTSRVEYGFQEPTRRQEKGRCRDNRPEVA
jgi:hypothetical protein